MTRLDAIVTWWQHLNSTDQAQWIGIIIVLAFVALSGKKRR